jgi:hypothetical protein
MYRYTEDLKVASIVETSRLDVTEIDIPALTAVYDYWDRQRGDTFAPSLKQFRLDDLAPAIVPNMAVVDFVGPPLDYFYRFFGSKMVEVSGMELTGKTYYADGIEGYGFVNAEIFPEMIAERRPICTRTHWISVRALHYATITVRLPISADGESVTSGVTVNQFHRA